MHANAILSKTALKLFASLLTWHKSINHKKMPFPLFCLFWFCAMSKRHIYLIRSKKVPFWCGTEIHIKSKKMSLWKLSWLRAFTKITRGEVSVNPRYFPDSRAPFLNAKKAYNSCFKSRDLDQKGSSPAAVSNWPVQLLLHQPVSSARKK